VHHNTGRGVPLDLQPLVLLALLPQCQADERMGIWRYADPTGGQPQAAKATANRLQA